MKLKNIIWGIIITSMSVPVDTAAIGLDKNNIANLNKSLKKDLGKSAKYLFLDHTNIRDKLIKRISHYSHRSHQSHQSHISHYSSTSPSYTSPNTFVYPIVPDKQINVYQMVIVDLGNIRQQPDINAPIIAQAKYGAMLFVVEIKSGWKKVAFSMNNQSYVGWISGELLK